jgi:hypothetical protein
MKNYILFLSATFCLNVASAQTVQVTSQKADFSVGDQNALVTTIFQSNKNDVEDQWKDFLKDFKNEKVKSDKNEVIGDNILFKDWGNNTVDVYTRFEENKNDKSVKMFVAFDLGGAFLTASKDPEKYALAVKMVKGFAIQATRYPIEKELKMAEKQLDHFDDDQKDLERQNGKLHDDINENKKKIENAESDIKKNEEAQSKKKAEIEAQKALIESVKKSLQAVK